MHRFIVGVAFGIAVELCLLIPGIENIRIFEVLNNFAMDSMIGIYAARNILPNPDSGLSYIFIDIDERTFREWNEPFFTPRDKLLEMICWAVKGKSSAVIVDLDLSHSLADMEASAGDSRLPPADQKFWTFVHNSSEKCPAISGPDAEEAFDAGAVPIVLLRTFYPTQVSLADACQVQRDSFLEKPDANVRGNIYWGTSEEPALILLDLRMPRMNGVEAASVLRGRMPNVRIVLLTLYDEVLSCQSIMSAIGFDAVISKPDGFSTLGECVRGLLGSAPAPPEDKT